MFRALKLDHMHFRDSLLGVGWDMQRSIGIAKFEVSTITWNKDIKGTAKICKNYSFKPPFRGLGVHPQRSSTAQCKVQSTSYY